jgi:hypothetical protein
MFQFPGFAFIPYVFRNKYLAAHDDRITEHTRTSRPRHPLPSDHHKLEVGFPIRKSRDQSPFAAPPSLSQRTTSFIASQRQGIHRILLRHLIALIIDNPQTPSAGEPRDAGQRPAHGT